MSDKTTVPRSTTEQQTQFAAVYGVLQAAIAGRAFPGGAFGVLFRGRVVALDAVGRFTYLADSPAVTPGTVYDLASITKVVATTAAAMLLYDRGVLDLDQPAGDILPGFVVGMEPGSGKERVTLRMLLAHSSGLPAYARLFEAHNSPQQMLRACLRMPLEALPDTRAEYSDIGFILLGAAIGVLSGQNFASFCSREIFEPLGMANTRFCPPQTWRDAIPPTEDDTTFRHRVIQGEVHDENCFALGGATGHAGVFSSCADLLRFAQCILSGGRTVDDHQDPAAGADDRSDSSARVRTPLQLLQRTTVETFATRQTVPAGTSRALGWDTPSAPSTSGQFFSAGSVGHLGFTGTSLWIDRERDLAVVLLTNRTWPDRGSRAIRQVYPLFHDAVIQSLQVSQVT